MTGLITTPENLARHVERSIAKRDKKLDAVQERENAALGALADFYKREDSPENLGFGLFATMIPSMVSASPSANITSAGGRAERVQAAALSAAVTQMAEGSKMHRALEPCAWDIMFKPFCAGFVEVGQARMSDLTDRERRDAKGRLATQPGVPQDVGGEAEDVPHPRGPETTSPQIPPHWARFKRLNPRECGFDMQPGAFDQARFTFHEVIEERELLIARAEKEPESWRPLAVRVAPCVQADGKAPAAGTEERYVRYFVVYVPGGTIDDEPPGPNQPGVIYTISASGVDSSGSRVSGIELRAPYYFEGHPDGPHVFGGQFTTGADAMFVNLLGANEDAMAMLESVSASIHQRIRDHKVVTAFRAVDLEDVQKVADARHGDYVAINTPDMGRFVEQIETNALTPAEVSNYQGMIVNAQRQLGVQDATSGYANADATATAVAEAAQATDVKVEYLIQRWNRFVGEALERMAFYAASDDRVFVRLNDTGREAVLRAELQPLVEAQVLPGAAVEQIVEMEANRPMAFQGGDFNAAGGELDWSSLRLTVKPNSMTGAQSRAMVQREIAWNNQLAFLLQQMIAAPHGRWIDRIWATGRAMGIDDAELSVDVEIAQKLAQAQMAQPSPSYTTQANAGPGVPRAGGFAMGPQVTPAQLN